MLSAQKSRLHELPASHPLEPQSPISVVGPSSQAFDQAELVSLQDDEEFLAEESAHRYTSLAPRASAVRACKKCRSHKWF